MSAFGPQRIVCMSTETCEVLYALGEQQRIVGISGFTVRPPQARKEKPKIGAFTSAKHDEILALQPDLVLGLEVHLSNQRGIAGMLSMIRTLGALVGATERAEALIQELEQRMAAVAAQAATLPRRPRVYFEEWNEPLISGIGWVSELITLAGGEDCFSDLATLPRAKQRIIADPLEVVRRAPDIIIGSWCGKRFRPEQVVERDGWGGVPAVAQAQLFEIKSADILQPGIGALTDGLDQLAALIRQWAQS